MAKTWEIIIHNKTGVSKTFTDFDSEWEAQERCKNIARYGYFSSEPNGNGSFYYPPHRVMMIEIKPSEES